MGKPASGSRDFAKDGTVIVRISLGGGASRISVPLHRLPGDPHVDWLQGAIVEHARTLFAAGTVTRDELTAELNRAARVTVGLDGAMLRPAWERMIRDGLVAQNIAKDRATRVGKTVRDVGELWMDGKIPGLKERACLKDLKYQLTEYIYPEIGHVPLEAVDVDHLTQVFNAERCAHLTQGARVGLWNTAARVISLAVYPLRLIKVHPIPSGARPRQTRHRVPATLWPTDDQAVCECTAISVHDRVFFAYLAREGARMDDAWDLTWAGVIKMGKANVLRAWWRKTKKWGQWVASAGTVEGLEQYRDMYFPNAKSTDRIFHPTFPQAHAALYYRKYLEAAGLRKTRPILFERGTEAGSQDWARAHDLRALWVTLGIARRLTDAEVREHTGHTSAEMIRRYTREAELFRAAGWLDLTPLNLAIPELRTGQIIIATDACRLLPGRGGRPKQLPATIQ